MINNLYTIKLFLAQWDTNFGYDIQVIAKLKSMGAKCDYKLYKALEQRFEPLLGTRRVKENIARIGQFKQFKDKQYLHDELHEHFAYYDKPLYKTILKSDSHIYTSKKKFMSLSEEDKFKCALEELYTVTTERLIIPFGYPIQEAKSLALRRLCIGLTKGYFNIYLLENYFELLYYDNTYFEGKLNELGEYIGL